VSSPAPVDPAALEPALRPFGQSTTLPAEAYLSEAVFDWEMREFFEAGWVCAGRASELDAVGDRRAVAVGRESVLLLRDGSAVRGFFNVCRHRGHELLAVGASGGGGRIQCPYHGWEYGLDGRLRSAPRLGQRVGFDAAAHGLASVAVVDWEGWVMVNVSGTAAAFEQTAGDLVQRIAAHRPGSLVVAASSEYTVEANWKLIVENYHECYHCPEIHPELCRVTPPTSGMNYRPAGLWVGGVMDLMPDADTMSVSGRSQAPPLPGLGEEQRRHIYYFGLFPNLLISLHPDYVLTHRLDPLGPRQTRVACEWLFPPEVIARSGFDPGYAVEFWDITNRQDWKACESVQRGVSSRAYRQGPIAAPEDAVYQFVTMVADAYRDGRVRPPRAA
jgi:Rieske 2Fe-2S family protein